MGRHRLWASSTQLSYPSHLYCPAFSTGIQGPVFPITWSESEAPRLRTWTAPSARWFMALLRKLETALAARGSEIPARAPPVPSAGGKQGSREVRDKGGENSGATHPQRPRSPKRAINPPRRACPHPLSAPAQPAPAACFTTPCQIGRMKDVMPASAPRQEQSAVVSESGLMGFRPLSSKGLRVPQRHPAFPLGLKKAQHNSNSKGTSRLSIISINKASLSSPYLQRTRSITYALTIFSRTNWFIPLPCPLHLAGKLKWLSASGGGTELFGSSQRSWGHCVVSRNT